MPLHGLSVAAGQDEARADATLGTDGTENIGRLGALVFGRRGPGAASRPTPRELCLLANPGFILPPNFYGDARRERAADFPQCGGEFFLKSSTASSFWP